MSAVVAMPPVKPGDQSTPSASPAAPAAVEFRYTQTDSFVALLHQLGASLLVSTYQANKLLVARASGRRAVDAGAHVRPADGPGRGRPPAGHRHAQGGLVPAQRPGHRPAGRAGRPARRLLPAALRRTSPATSASTRSPGPARSCGSSTRASRACARCTPTTASCRAGGRRSSPPWPPRTAAI